MGEVYRARDTRLGRIVAIKVLPRDFALDEKRRARFEREAKTIASLSHPHICALYDVGESSPPGDDQASAPIQYLVLENLEGQTLDQVLRSGPLPLAQVLRYGIEIADALDKAHRKQILHRDIKPSNIMITKDGAKLLDFGLAKVASARPTHSSAGPANDETTEEKPLTSRGAILGTHPYAAPEQLEGKEADARTDIFSFGVLLYEMAAGRRPFVAQSAAALTAAILKHDPAPIATYRPAVPSSLDWLVRSCLAKDPDDRMQTAHDVMLELRRMAEEQPVPAASVVPMKRAAGWYLLLLLVAIAVAASLAYFVRTPRPLPQPVRRFTITLPDDAPLSQRSFQKLAVSQDGRRVVYVGGEHPTHLYVHAIDLGTTAEIPGTENAQGPFFSPRGDWIGFYTPDGALKKVSSAGGAVVTLRKGADLRGASWGPNDRIIFGELWSTLFEMSAAGGAAKPIIPNDPKSSFRWPVFLPDGKHILYTRGDYSGDYENARLSVLSLETGKEKVIVDGGTFGRYSTATQHLIYFHSDTLYAVPFAPGALNVNGPPTPIVFDVDSYPEQGLAHFAVAGDGSIFYVPRDPRSRQRQLVWVDRSGNRTSIAAPMQAYNSPRISPDGKQVLVGIERRGGIDLWIYDSTRGSFMRLTEEASNEAGIWSPDGTQIAFASNRNRGYNIFLMPSDGSGRPRQLTSLTGWPFPSSWSPDGSVIAIQQQRLNQDIDVLPIADPQKPQPFATTRSDELNAAFSPDGRWIAYSSDESGRPEIYVQRYPGGGRKRLVSTQGGLFPVWRRDGREMFYFNGSRMMAVDIAAAGDSQIGTPRVLFEGEFDEEFDVTPDGKHFLMIKRQSSPPPTRINVILGLFDNLASQQTSP